MKPCLRWITSVCALGLLALTLNLPQAIAASPAAERSQPAARSAVGSATLDDIQEDYD
jgi:hypothetical protein